MKLPSSGPITGAVNAGQVISAIACTSSDLRAFFSTMIRPTGVISALPAPCTARATTNSARPPESPQNSEAMVKTAMDAMKTRLAPYRSPSHPERGMKAAIVSM